MGSYSFCRAFHGASFGKNSRFCCLPKLRYMQNKNYFNTVDTLSQKQCHFFLIHLSYLKLHLMFDVNISNCSFERRSRCRSPLIEIVADVGKKILDFRESTLMVSFSKQICNNSKKGRSVTVSRLVRNF